MKTQIAPSGALGYRQVTALSVVKTLADGAAITGSPPAIPPLSRFAVIQAEGQAVRWTDDGTAPEAGKGMRLLVGVDLIYDGDPAALKFLEETAGAKLNVSYYKYL